MASAAATALRRARVVDLYRRSLREIPRVLSVFDMEMPERELRLRVRDLFRKHDHIEDPRVVEFLLHRGELDLEETVEVWKQKSHLYRLLGMDETETARPVELQGESAFLRSFYANN
eukprot:CAMPEP_0202088404 /NCGR_PEP_ID=MMETSP0964-20121228/38512_1 /ASSEMBLY_ACC=CAM_ASM_000500 /TAXON_ID=4773 /ORGANISM="Schizochytrium aggregatum, Strain ATCC28209" /LENGTH=116 /DNA_ID=CAMNT_0048656421 /DNA_START=99 /DNA_END=449 /DNA_ORIENTATION=-